MRCRGSGARPSGRCLDFFDVKGDLEALLALTGEPEAFYFRRRSHPALHPGQTARIYATTSPWVGWALCIPRLV
ncbi:MAG: hypothetical protein U1F68_18695 [Gammaproteobacteria bacterium]